MPRKPVVQYEPCQRKHHSWYEGTDPTWVPPFGMAGEVEICDYCGTVRRRAIDALGRTSHIKYIHPEGYSMPRDERPSKAELRAEWFKREKRMGRVASKRERRLKAVS